MPHPIDLKTKLAELKAFDSNLTSILSKQRLKGYENIEHYYHHKLFAFEVGNKVAELEIYLRNKLDFCLTLLYGADWIQKEHLEIKGKTSGNLNSDQILSSLTLGQVVELIEKHKIANYIFYLETMDFKKYHSSNRNFGYINKKKISLSNIRKVKIVLNLIRNIRNRTFHWENLYKLTIKRVNDQEMSYPRITHKDQETGVYIGIHPDQILNFLDDLMRSIGNPELEKYKDLEVKYK